MSKPPNVDKDTPIIMTATVTLRDVELANADFEEYTGVSLRYYNTTVTHLPPQAPGHRALIC